MKKLTKAIAIIATILSILIANLLLMMNCVEAASIKSISQVDLHSRGVCTKLLTYKGVAVKTNYVEYTYDGVSYPAYCINRDLEGVTESLSYSVTPNGVIDDVGLWRRIINGYPYKTLSELGVSSEEEAFTATKQAVYCYLYGNALSDYAAIGDAGQRTLNALNQICSNAENSSETYLEAKVTISPVSEEWTKSESDTAYMEKTYSVTSNSTSTSCKIELSGDFPEGTKITDINGVEKTEFSRGDKFKILLPIEKLTEDGSFTINVQTEVKTKPVIYGATPNSSWQNYALTAYVYEEASTSYTDTFSKQETPETPETPEETQEETTTPVAQETKILPVTGM